MNKIRDWLRIFRSQTAPATIILVLVSFLMGGGKLFSIWGVCIGVFALLMHYFSFGHNSLMDTQGGWDKEDKSKTHHPLITGSIKMETAHNIIHAGLLLLTFFAIILVWYSTGNHVMSLLFFCLFLTAGHSYNDGMSKSSVWGFLPIVMCFTAFSFFGFYLVAKHMSSLMLWVGIYFALTLLFQISYSGHLKEIETVGANLLRRLGAKVTTDKGGFLTPKDFFIPGYAGVYGWIIKIINIIVGGCIVFYFIPHPVSIVLFIFFAWIMLYFCHQLTKIRRWDRNKSLKDMSLMEVCTIYMIPAILMPLIGYFEGIVLMLFGLIYFIILNKVNWGTMLKPRV